MTRLLASVCTPGEALAALEGGADIIDFKDPSQGALGALSAETIRTALASLQSRAVTSATAGDWPLEPNALLGAVERTAATGVDFVKLGLLPGVRLHDCIDALAAAARKQRLIAVFFADRGVPSDAAARLHAAGFAGAMIDTFDKQSGSLRAHLDDDALAHFVGTLRALGMLSGLAGSLRIDDIAPLARLAPDYLGFRGALCTPGARASALELDRVREVAHAIASATPKGTSFTAKSSENAEKPL